MDEIKAYRCEFCKKLFVTKWRCIKHEHETCMQSTKVKNCRTCKYNEYDQDGWHCSKLDNPIDPEDIPICCEHHILKLKKGNI